MDGLKKIHGKDVEVHIPQPKLFDPSYLGKHTVKTGLMDMVQRSEF